MTSSSPEPMKGISLVVPALNEEQGVRAAVSEAVRAVERFFPQYEVILVNDGSTDGTLSVMEDLARANPRMRIIDHRRNLGLGTAVRDGFAAARFEYAMWSSGDVCSTAILERIFARAGEAEIVIPYPASKAERQPVRRFVSVGFTAVLNALFGLRVRYYNGGCLFPVRLLRQFEINTSSFAFQAEILVKLLTAGHSYVEVCIDNEERKGGRSKAVTVRNAAGVLWTVIRLFWTVRIRPLLP